MRGGVFKQVISEAYVLVKLMEVVQDYIDCVRFNSRENHKIMLLHQQQRQVTSSKQITRRLQIQLSRLSVTLHWQTNRTLLIRTREHALTDKESAIYKHLRTCEHLTFIHNLFNLPDTLNNIITPTVSGNNEYAINTVQNNTTEIDYDDNWNLLIYKAAFHIKRQSSSLNNGLKSSRELCLFS